MVSWFGTGLQWVTRLGSRQYWTQDHCEVAFTAVSRDPLLEPAQRGLLRRKVRLCFYTSTYVYQIFHVLLAHLTTTIVEIDTYLMTSSDPRADLDNLSIFRHFIPEMFKGKGKAAAAPEPGSAADVQMKKDMADATEYLSLIGLSLSDFLKHYQVIITVMKWEFTARDRLESSLPVRLVSMSGPAWNMDSCGKHCDWGLLAIAFTLESVVCPPFRKELVCSCLGAAQLRRQLHRVFEQVTIPTAVPNSSVNYEVRKVWEFPDGLALEEQSAASFPELGALTAAWEAARDSSASADDPALGLIRSLENNKYLRSADGPEVETLAHHLITSLAQVCPSPFACALCSLSFRLSRRIALAWLILTSPPTLTALILLSILTWVLFLFRNTKGSLTQFRPITLLMYVQFPCTLSLYFYFFLP